MEHEEIDTEVGIVGGWFCSACDHVEPDDFPDDDLEYAPP